MAVDYKPLNRQQDFTVQQKASLKKIFQAAEAAAAGSSSAVSRELVHRYLANHWDGDARHDIQALMAAIRAAVDATNNAYDIDSVISAFRMEGNKKKVLRVMANAVIAAIV
jgi:hypothetical protein